MDSEECHRLHRQLDPRWHLNGVADRLFCSLGPANACRDAHLLFREFGELSESENHHPELRWSRGRLDVEIWTHKIGALVESDFILAAKMDGILERQDISTTAFDHLYYQDLSWDLEETDRSWHNLSKQGFLACQLRFKNFERPWKYVLQLLAEEGGSWAEWLEIGLGFGRLEIRMVNSCEKTLFNKVNMLTDQWIHL